MRVLPLAAVAALLLASPALADVQERVVVAEEVVVEQDLPAGAPAARREVAVGGEDLTVPNPARDLGPSADALVLHVEALDLFILLPWREAYAVHRHRVVVDPDDPVAALVAGETGILVQHGGAAAVELAPERDALRLAAGPAGEFRLPWSTGLSVRKLVAIDVEPLLASRLDLVSVAGETGLATGYEGSRSAACTLRAQAQLGPCGSDIALDAGDYGLVIRATELRLWYRSATIETSGMDAMAHRETTSVVLPPVLGPWITGLLQGRAPRVNDGAVWKALDGTWQVLLNSWRDVDLPSRLPGRYEQEVAADLDVPPEARAATGSEELRAPLPEVDLLVEVREVRLACLCGPSVDLGMATLASPTATEAPERGPAARLESATRPLPAAGQPGGELEAAPVLEAPDSGPRPPAGGEPLRSAAVSHGSALPEVRSTLLAALIGLGLAVPIWSLYRRVREARALDNEQRRRIYETIVASPGSTAGDLRRETGLHYTTCQHHVRILHELRLIEVKKVGGAIRCFENHSRYGAVESRLLAACRGSTTRQVLERVRGRPGIQPSEVADALGLSRSTAKHHVDRLVSWGLVEARREGPHLHLALVAGVEAAMARLVAVPASATLS